MPEVIDYSAIPEIKTVPVLEDFKSSTQQEFAARFSNQPVIIRNICKGALTDWKNARLMASLKGDLDKKVLANFHKVVGNGSYRAATTVTLRDFIQAVGGADDVYLAEWYLFGQHPELLSEIISLLPEYLLDDWLEGCHEAGHQPLSPTVGRICIGVRVDPRRPVITTTTTPSPGT